MSYVTLTKPEFESYLPAGFVAIETKAKEYVYEGKTDTVNVGIRIFSSVDIRTDRTRDLGTDAIRLVYWDILNDRPLGKGRRINRVEGATTIGDRIQHRIDSFMLNAYNQTVIDFGYVAAVLNSNAVNYNNFAKSLLDSLEKYDRLTDAQLVYVLGAKNPKGWDTFEAIAKKKDPDFLQKYLDSLMEEDKDEDAKIEEFERASDDHEAEEETVTQEVKTCPVENVDLERLTETKEYEDYSYPFSNFNPVQSTVLPKARANRNMIIGANTSAGKTICAEIIMDHVLKNELVIYLSPLKSLTQEKYDDWQKRFPNEEITILTGDYTLSEKMKEKLSQSSIIVMTSEMCDSRTRRMQSEKNYWLKRVGLVIVDESHILTTNRGHAVETGIMRFTSINKEARILFLSATMPNVDELGRWLTLLNGKKTEVIYSTWRPVELQINYIEYPIVTQRNGWEDYWASQEEKRSKAVEIALSKPDEKFLIFCHDKGTGRNIVRRLKEKGVESIFHNADLNLKDRIEIENSFQNRDNGIRVLVSTSTLAWGRNLPARNVIIVGVHRGLNEVDELDIVQMSGRAGRYGIDDAGFVYLIIPEGGTNNWVEVFKSPRPVLSVLNKRSILAFHVLAEVQNRVITNVGEMLEWYRRSLASMQNIIPFERVDAEGLIHDLIGMEMLTGDPNLFAITGLGKVSAWLYFSPYDVYKWYKNFDQIFGQEITDETIAWALADIPSNNPGYIRKDLKEMCDEWRWMLRNRGIATTDALPSVIGAFNALGGLNNEIISSFKRASIYDIDRQCQAFSLIDGMFAKWGKENFWKTLPLRVKYGIEEEMCSLVTLPGIGGVRAKKLWDRGFKSLSDVADMDKKRDLMTLFKAPMVKRIMAEAAELLKD